MSSQSARVTSAGVEPTPDGKGLQSKGFQAASEVKANPEEQSYQRTFSDVLRLYDFANAQVRDSLPEGFGYCIEVGIDGFSQGIHIKASTIPPPAKGGGGYARQSVQPAAFSKEKVMEVVGENPDLLGYAEVGGKVQVTSKRFLGDQWGGVNEKLRAAGLRWGELGEKDGRKIKGWTQQ